MLSRTPHPLNNGDRITAMTHQTLMCDRPKVLKDRSTPGVQYQSITLINTSQIVKEHAVLQVKGLKNREA